MEQFLSNHPVMAVPKTEKAHIIFIGRKNTGKSSLVNAFFGQNISDVSEIPGTTTTAVFRAMELLPYGPVVLVDTAGIDNADDFGKKRISKTIISISSADFAVVILDARVPLTPQEVELFFYLDKISIPYVVAVNKIEFGVNPKLLVDLKNLKLMHFEISCKEKVGIDELKKKVIRMLPHENDPPIIGDIVSKGEVVVFVVPVENSSNGNDFVPSQIQTIREALDEDIISVVVKDKELSAALACLNVTPNLVIADSQSVVRVAVDVPEKIKLTTFSLVMARYKGDLPMYIRGLKRVDELNDGDKILIAEACTFHSGQDDIGRIKIPKWLRLHTKKDLIFDYLQGTDFPDNLSDYKLIIHCGACRISRKMMQVRLNLAKIIDVPVVNYGVMISYMNGALPRTLLPFHKAVSEWNLIKN